MLCLIVAQVSIVPQGSLVLNQTLVLECQITSTFPGGASWSQDYGMTLLTTCYDDGTCTFKGPENYNYSSTSSGIFVTIFSLTADEIGKTWTCLHTTFNDNYTIVVPEPGKCILFYEIYFC